VGLLAAEGPSELARRQVAWLEAQLRAHPIARDEQAVRYYQRLATIAEAAGAGQVALRAWSSAHSIAAQLGDVPLQLACLDALLSAPEAPGGERLERERNVLLEECEYMTLRKPRGLQPRDPTDPIFAQLRERLMELTGTAGSQAAARSVAPPIPCGSQSPRGSAAEPRRAHRGVLSSLPLLVVLGAAVPGAAAAQAPRAPAEICREDLQAAFGLVERNYSGYADKLVRIGADAIEAAKRDGLAAIGSAQPLNCTALINNALWVFKERHMGVVEASAHPGNPAGPAESQPADDPKRPSFEILSSAAALIRAPSFDSRYEKAIAALIEQQREAIAARPQLIIDVRGNGGGSDSVYEPLADLVYSGPVKSFGLDGLASAENIVALENMVVEAKKTGEDHSWMEERIARLREKPGQFVEIAESKTSQRAQVYVMPQKVAVLINRRCGSSCEEFLLEARQSSKVRLFGEPSAGNLDYANLLPHPLPSGRVLWVGMSRSHRLPEQPLDGIGVPPNVAMDPALFDGPQRGQALARVLAELQTPAGSEGSPLP
jgi:hypothetical protein